jgi:epoxyqueuosine reductase
MSKFHSTVNRRDFMKGLGLAGAGIGAAATAPVFHDLDEVMSSSYGEEARPWWVTKRELMDPTQDVDWDIMKRYDRRDNAQNSNVETLFYGAEMEAARDMQDPVEEAHIANGDDGYSVKQRHFAAAYNRVRRAVSLKSGFVGIDPGESMADTPEESGMPKWVGTPEENAKLFSAATRIFGGAYMGYAELDSTWRNKLVISHTTKTSARIEFEDVDQGYAEKDPSGEMKERWVIPNKPMWAIAYGAPEALFSTKTAPSLVSKPNQYGTLFMKALYTGMFNLLRSMGYQMIGDMGHQSMPLNAGATAVLTGIAESSRNNQYVLTPEAGPRINHENVLTDLPLAPTPPIDAGIFKFCHSCGLCADTCPGGWINSDKEPSYDVGTYNGKPGIFHNAGPKNFWCDAAGCRMQFKRLGGRCHICYGVCPFNEGREAMMHNFVKSTLATTSLFNGFFANMSDMMGFGLQGKEEWWDHTQPVFGLESEVFAKYR